jgi:hypothetical protein
MKKSSELYEFIMENYYSMSKEELKQVICEIIYECDEVMTDNESDRVYTKIENTLREYEIIK